MRKYATLGLTCLLVMPTTAVFANEEATETNTVTEQAPVNTEGTTTEIIDGVTTDGTSTEEGNEEGSFTLDPVESLTLQDAITRALDENMSLMLLKYQIEIADKQAGNATYNLRDSLSDIRDLERQKDRLREKQGSASFAERLAIQTQLEALDDALLQLNTAQEQINNGEQTLLYSEAEAREGVKLNTTSTYVQLLLAQQQIDLQKKALESTEKTAGKMKVQLDLGLISQEDYNQQLRQIDVQKVAISQAEQVLQKDMIEFALDLGIDYTESFSLQPVDMSSPTIPVLGQEAEQPAPAVEELMEELTEEQIAELLMENLEPLVQNTFTYKKQASTAELEKVLRDNVYADEDATSYEKDEADLAVVLQEQTLEKTKLDVEQSIRTLYANLATAYQGMKDAERDLEYAKKDYETLEKRYNAGFVARIDYELAVIEINQAELQYEAAQHQYYLVTKQMEALQAGIIVTNQAGAPQAGNI